MSLLQYLRECLKMAFGTDERCRKEPVSNLTLGNKAEKKPSHMTDVLADNAERKIDRMNAATNRLANLRPADNVDEAIRQLVGK
jgi:hypothetical protein